MFIKFNSIISNFLLSYSRYDYLKNKKFNLSHRTANEADIIQDF